MVSTYPGGQSSYFHGVVDTRNPTQKSRTPITRLLHWRFRRTWGLRVVFTWMHIPSSLVQCTPKGEMIRQRRVPPRTERESPSVVRGCSKRRRGPVRQGGAWQPAGASLTSPALARGTPDGQGRHNKNAQAFFRSTPTIHPIFPLQLEVLAGSPYTFSFHLPHWPISHPPTASQVRILLVNMP